MSQIGLMHLTDTLHRGGAERVAVNLANLMPRSRYRLHLCTTRDDGPLVAEVAKDVGRLRLDRNHRFDLHAVHRLRSYIRQHHIEILHAHGTSLFIARLAASLSPYPAVVWHEHYGRNAAEDRRSLLYRLAAMRIGAAICVNGSLAEWSTRRLKIPAERVWYVPNFVYEGKNGKAGPEPELPGVKGARIVNIANYRPEKDQLTLLRAMSVIVRKQPAAHLFLVGVAIDQSYIESLRASIASLGLESHVSMLGPRDDVARILALCDIGVLSSATEGLPMALLEYGLAAMPAVATDVGQCGEVLDQGRAGLLVPPSEFEPLAEALLSLLGSSVQRANLGRLFQKRIQEIYSPGPVIEQLEQIYETVLKPRRRRERRIVSPAVAAGRESGNCA